MRSIPSLLLAITTTCAGAQNKFTQMERAVQAGQYPNLHSILVSQNGQMGYGQYRYRWTVDPSGHGMTTGSFYITPKDMLKIGQLALNQGEWHGEQIVSRSWIRESTHAQILIPDGSFAKTSRSSAATPQPAYYGCQWYNEVIQTKSGSYPVIFASGNGGQYIMIVEPLKIVAVFTQGNYGKRVAKQAFHIMARYVLP